MEWNLWNTGKVADPKSPVGGSYAFSKPKPQSVEISNSSFVLQFASRRFLDQLLGGEDNARANRQLKDAEFGNKDIGRYILVNMYAYYSPRDICLRFFSCLFTSLNR